MKHRSEHYGQALAEAILAGRATEDAIRKNFVALVKKNGDEARFPRIVAEAERILRNRTGTRKLTIESARPLTAASRKELAKMMESEDAVEEKINPGLVAGVRVTVNEDLQWDGSLQKKIQKLFAYQ